MANFLGDATFGSGFLVLEQPQVVTASANGTGGDTSPLTGNGLNAALMFGAGTGTGTLDIKLQESDTLGGTYTDIPGATFTTLVVANVNSLYKVFTQKQTKRYVRAAMTVGGTVSFSVAVLLFGQLRNSGNASGFATAN